MTLVAINSKIIKASVWNIIGTFLLKAISFLSVPIFTRLMSQDDYGYISTYTTYISFMGIVVGLGLNTAIFNARMDFEDRFNDYNSSIIKAAGVVCVSEVIIANLISSWICPPLGLNRLYLNLIIAISFAEYVVNSYYKINTVDFKFKKNVVFSILNSLFNISLSTFFILLFNDDILGKLLGQSLFIVVLALVVFYLIAFKRANTFKLSDVQYSLKVGIPNIFHQFSQLIMSQSDRVMILHFISAAATAKYSVVYTYALVIQMLWNAINEVWVPWLYRKIKIGANEVIIKYSKYYVMIFAILAGICMLIMPDFMFILAPDSYSDSKDIISIVILATFFLYLYSFFVNLELYHKKNLFTAIATLFAALVNIIGNAILIPMFGYKAAAYTTLGAYLFLMLIHYLITDRILKINIYSISFFAPYSAFVCIMAIIANSLLEAPVIRWGIVFVIIFIGLLYIKKNFVYISRAIKEIRSKKDGK